MFKFGAKNPQFALKLKTFYFCSKRENKALDIVCGGSSVGGTAIPRPTSSEIFLARVKKLPGGPPLRFLGREGKVVLNLKGGGAW